VIFALLGCYTALIATELPTFRDNLPLPSSTAKLPKKKRGNALFMTRTPINVLKDEPFLNNIQIQFALFKKNAE
jgi:hypothetical protein